MPVQLRNLLDSLSLRLLVPLFLTVVAVLFVHALLSFRSTKDQFQTLVEGHLHRSSDLIRRATHDGMLLNRMDEVQSSIEQLAASPELVAVRVYDKQGRVVLSGRPGEVGARVRREQPPCSSCHKSGQPASAGLLEAHVVRDLEDGGEVLRHLSVIENEPACTSAGCHLPPDQERILGVLDVEASMAPLSLTLRTARSQLIWTTLVLILIVGVVATVFVRRLIVRPVHQLYAGTQRIAAGDLDTPIDVKGQHELARLAQAFNRMAEDLSQAREELTHWSQRLEDKVVEKTDELRRAQRQVLHMEKMASLGRLSATVAHELNNPISGVLTYARLVDRELKEQPLGPEVKQELGRYLGLMEKECVRCGSIVRNMLLFARREGGEMAPVDLNEIVERSLMLVRHHLEIKQVRLESRPLAGDSQIVADGGQLQQALVALFVNAVEAMEGCQPKELSVDLEGDEQEVRIDVKDSGAGISPEALPHIFEPFFSTKDKESGVGLGLAVVYGIVHRHGGAIEIQSDLGRGTTFRLRLPRTAKNTGGSESPGDGATEAAVGWEAS